MSIAENLERIGGRIARAAARAGRKPEEITLVAVSKTFSAEAIREAYAAGVRHFGENRVQEWEGKQPQLGDLDATWHLVGHLQGNKARRAARLFHWVDSVDSVELAQKLERFTAEDAEGAEQELEGRNQKAEAGTKARPNTEDTEEPFDFAQGRQRATEGRLSVLIEVRLAAEETKAGVAEAELPRLVEAVLALPHLELCGLMCIPPFFEDAEKVRPYFRRLREWRDDLRSRLAGRALQTAQGSPPLQVLSMGMSHDFEVAIEEGATQVRLGTAIFGDRPA
jgi:uncharacterized pyridoxal phosphate-containing UPF0001 family protein